MTSIQNRLENILKISEQIPSSSSQLSNQVSRLSRINQVEKAANSSFISQIAPKIIYNVVNNIGDNIGKINQTAAIERYTRIINQIRQFLPTGSVESSYLSQLNETKKALQSRGRQLSVSRNRAVQQNLLINRLVTDQLNANPQLTPQNSLKLPQSGNQGLDRDLTGIVDIIDNPPPTGILSLQNLPPTMQLLAKYTQKLGYKPTGQLTGRKSRVYVGVETITEGDDMQISKPFPFIQSKNTLSQSASIKQTFRNFAGKTITAWNNYVGAEQAFVQFANKISSKQKRQQYVKNQIKTMTSQTFCAQGLATLINFYIATPLFWMIQKSKRTMATMTQEQRNALYSLQWFIEGYQLPPGASNNPLALSYDTIKTLILRLVNSDTSYTTLQFQSITKAWTQILDLLQGKSILPNGKANMKRLTGYVKQKQMQAKVYLKSLGIPEVKITAILNGDVNGITLVKINLPNIYANVEVLELINRAIKEGQDPDAPQVFKQGLYDIIWTNQSLPSRNYVWNKDL